MFILWYSASSTFGKDSDIVMGVRADGYRQLDELLQPLAGAGVGNGEPVADRT